MTDNTGKIKSFTDLIVWKEGHKLVLNIYKATDLFPKSETYSLIDQMRRAASSVTANIAEGFTRPTFRAKLQFYHLAQGSLMELKNYLIIARDVNYINQEDWEHIIEQVTITDKLLQGFLQKTKTFLNPES